MRTQIPSRGGKRSPRCNWLPSDGTDDPKTLAHFCWTSGQFSCLTGWTLFGCFFFFFFLKRTFGFTEISFILFQNPRQTSQTTPIYLGWECLNSLRRSRPSALDNAELHHAVSNVSRLKRQFGADLLPDTNTEQYAAPVCVQSAWSDETQLKTAQKNSWWGSSNIITAKVMETPQAIVIYFPACNTKLRIP